MKPFYNSSRIDIYIGSENSLVRNSFVASTAFFYDQLTLCVQKNKPIPMSEILFHLCNDPIVFAAFTFQAMYVTFSAYLAQMFETKPKWDTFRIGVNGIACYLGLPCKYYPKSDANRIGTIFVFFGGMYFAILLNTIIVKMYTRPMFNPQVKTTEQLIENEFSLIGNAFAYQKIAEDIQVFVYTKTQLIN